MSEESVDLDQIAASCSDTDALLSADDQESDNGADVQLQTSSEGSVVLTSKSTFNVGQLSSWLGRVCESASSAVLKGWVRQEIVTQFKLAIPVVLSLFFQYSMLLVSLLFIGHIPDSDSSLVYAAAGLAASYVNVTGISVGNGLATAADTLCSQAYGYKNYKRVGVILQRGILILGLFIPPICALWLNTQSLLLLFHQPPCVASLSGFYVNLYCIVLPFLFLYIVLQHYLQSQSIVWQFVVVGFITNCVNVLLHSVFIYAVPLGFKGAVLALVMSQCLPPVLVIFYIRVRKLHKLTWGGWSFESLNEWGQFIKLALPGMVMLCLEWWSAEVTTFIAGIISEEELAANSVWFQTMVILYMPPIGFSIATSIRVGNELGAGNPNAAKKASYFAVVSILILAVFYTVLLLTTKDYIGALFVPGNEIVRQKVSNLMYVACVFLYFDQVQVVIGGVLRGSGRQYIGAIMNFVGYYVIGLPLGITLAIKVQWGVLGLWIGMATGNIVHSLTFVVILLRTNWKKLSEIAIERAGGSIEGGTGETKVNDGSVGSPADDDSVQEVNETEINPSSSTQSTPNDQLPQTIIKEQCMERTELVSDTTCHSSLEERDSLMNDECEEKAVVNDEVHKEMEVISDTSSPSSQLEKRTRRQGRIIHIRDEILKLLSRGSLFVIGLVVLVVGGVVSRWTPYVEPGEYENCTVTEQ